MSNKTRLQTNNTNLQALIDKANALPDAGSSDPVLQEKIVMPNGSPQSVTFDNGYDGLSRVIVNGDDNLIAGNIKSGVSIFGVTGTYQGSGGGSSESVETCTVTIIDDLCITTPTIYYTDANMTLQSITTKSSILTVPINTLMALTNLDMSPEISGSYSTAFYNMGSICLQIIGNCTIAIRA